METTVHHVPTRFRLQKILDALDPPMAQRELARRTGVTGVTINAIANNPTTRVDLATLDAIADALDIEPGELLQHVGGRRKGGPRRSG